MHRAFISTTISVCMLYALSVGASGQVTPEVKTGSVDCVLNGLAISLDRETGGVTHLQYEGVETFLKASKERAGLLDLAFPIPEFEPLRLATRFSTGASVEISGQSVVIAWEKLGSSRAFALPGSVSATVEVRAATDGRSVILTANIHNRSSLPIRQVMFPDLAGLVPFAGADGTVFRTAGSVLRPFRDLQTSDLDRFYATNACFKVLKSGDSNDTEMIVRWMDLGGLQGGFSLFPRRWGWDPQTRVILHLSDSDKLLRLMNEHTVEIAPGERWSSGEFWLTPHGNGWAKGIEPYREWARQHIRRRFPVPDHVRKGLGFRSLWMCQNQPSDPSDATWRFSDLFALAEEAKEHGLDEMVMWIWHKPFVLPLPAPYPHLGTEQELIEAVRKCREIGVNVTPFISVLQAEKTTAERYGLSVTPGSGNWTYHTEFIPKFNPGYASRFTCVQVDTTDPRWQEDVLSSCTRLIQSGIPSLCWDQYWSVPEEPNLNTLTLKIRELAKEVDPESTFAGEELRNFEANCNYLDYTWNWKAHEHIQPLVSVFPSPRMNVNVNHAVETVYRCFADNLYMNVWPMKPDSTNGSDWISNDPELSEAVKRCAKLRAQFLNYFTDGTFIGECILNSPCEDAHVSAYVLPDKIFVIVTNAEAGGRIRLSCDPEPWSPSASGAYTLTAYNSEGLATEKQTIEGQRCGIEFEPIKAGSVGLFELTAQ